MCEIFRQKNKNKTNKHVQKKNLEINFTQNLSLSDIKTNTVFRRLEYLIGFVIV